MKRDAIDLGTVNVFRLFRKIFIPTLLGMLSMSAVTAIDGAYVGHGIGSDGMILICPSNIADFRMRVFNPDGTEAEMCGNGVRSVGKFVYDKGFTSKTEFTVETLGGIKRIYLDVENHKAKNITAVIGAPILEAKKFRCFAAVKDASIFP